MVNDLKAKDHKSFWLFARFYFCGTVNSVGSKQRIGQNYCVSNFEYQSIISFRDVPEREAFLQKMFSIFFPLSLTSNIDLYKNYIESLFVIIGKRILILKNTPISHPKIGFLHIRRYDFNQSYKWLYK